MGRKIIYLAAYIATILGLFTGTINPAVAEPSAASRFDYRSARWEPPCSNPGWFPEKFGLKDHHIFWHDGYYYLVAISVPNNRQFAYGRSADLCSWEELTPLSFRTGVWDNMVIWAPFVYKEDDTYYMFYTGVTKDFTQSILLATTEDPADPSSWKPQGVVFQPNHTGMIWEPGSRAHCRDPSVIRVGESYYLYYTGLDQNGGIIGMASADAISGPWVDWGRVLLAQPNTMLESPTVAQKDGFYYLFYNVAGSGENYRIGASPAGPWGEGLPFPPGWANEVWQTSEGKLFTSYLTDHSVSISPLSWDEFYHPVRPFIGEQMVHLLIPIILR